MLCPKDCFIIGDKVTHFFGDYRIIWQKSLKYLAFHANLVTLQPLARKLLSMRVKAEAKR